MIMDYQLHSSQTPFQLIKCIKNTDEYTRHFLKLIYILLWPHCSDQMLFKFKKLHLHRPLARHVLDKHFLVRADLHSLSSYLETAGHRIAQNKNNCSWANAESPSERTASYCCWQFSAWIRKSKCKPEQIDQIFGSIQLWEAS